MAIKNHDFVEMEYTARIKESGEVFDTTIESAAKDSGIYQEGMSFGPVIACIGEGTVLPGLEKKLESREVGEHDIELSPEEGFGKKSAKMIQLVPTSKFTKEKVVPMPGLQVNIDGLMGLVRAVTGGRTIVDFNHPLAGKTLVYRVAVRRIVTDEKEKVQALLKFHYKLVVKAIEAGEAGLAVTLAGKLPKEAEEELGRKLQELAGAKGVTFRYA